MLEKLWGLPAHPVYVHFPIAFFTLAGFLVLIHALDRKSHRINHFLKKVHVGNFDFESLSFLALLLGFGMGLVAILSGLKLVEGWKNLPVPHGPLGIGTMSCYLILLVVRWVYGPAVHDKGRLTTVYYLLHLLGVLLVVLTGYEGGELHYH